jgi:hypothetical protein
MADNTSQLRYPSDLADASADWVSFQFFKYKSAFGDITKGTSTGQTGGYINEYNEIQTGTSVYALSDTKYPNIAMYMPEDISANYAQTWGGREFHPIAAALMRQSSGIMQAKNAGDVMSKTGNVINNLMGSIYNSRDGLAPYMGAEGISRGINYSTFGGSVSANDVLASSQGRILNPNTEVLYQGPTLRTFGLTFKMTARSESESETIHEICRTFKRASLPEGNDTARNLINVPQIVQVEFKHKEDKSKWVAQYKQCAIGSVDINYTPDGAWSTFRTGAPTAVVLTLQFQELKLLFADDIAANNY